MQEDVEAVVSYALALSASQCACLRTKDRARCFDVPHLLFVVPTKQDVKHCLQRLQHYNHKYDLVRGQLKAQGVYVEEYGHRADSSLRVLQATGRGGILVCAQSVFSGHQHLVADLAAVTWDYAFLQCTGKSSRILAKAGNKFAQRYVAP